MTRAIYLLLSLSYFQDYAQSESIISPAALIEEIREAPSRVTDGDGNVLNDASVFVARQWNGDRCRPEITNLSKKNLRLGNIILFDLENTRLDPETPPYGEGFQMWSQT